MAKLSAYGRKVLFRCETHRPDTEYFTGTRVEYAFCSDGSVLSKMTARHKPDSLYPEGKNHSWGWKRLGRIRTGMEIQKAAEIFAAKRGVAVVPVN